MTALTQDVLIPRPDLIEIVGMYQDVVTRFTVRGEPASKARPRFTRYGSKAHAYTPEKTRAAEEAMAWQFKASGGVLEPSTEIAFGIIAVFHNSTRQRRDVDNMLKLVLDALNKVAWMDDAQVLEVAGRKRFVAKGMEHTEVIVYRLGEFPRKRAKCIGCGTMFITFDSLQGKVLHCSKECRERTAIAARTHNCPRCGSSFITPTKTEQTYCSKECNYAAGRIDSPCSICGTVFNHRKHMAGKLVYCSDDCRRKQARDLKRDKRTTRFPGTCNVCGGGTTRKEYVRCWACKVAEAGVTK